MTVTHRNQILHGDQTSKEETFYMADQPHPGKKICDTNTNM